LEKLVISIIVIDPETTPSFKAESLPIPINEVDISNLELPQSVAANASFERNVGYTQAEIRSYYSYVKALKYDEIIFIRIQYWRCSELVAEAMKQAQLDISCYAQIRTKYVSGLLVYVT